MMNIIPSFNEKYDNEENKEIIKKLLSQDNIVQKDISLFEEAIIQRLTTGYSTFYYIFSYYVEIYICFLYFNYYYENSLNWNPVPVYSPANVIRDILHQIPPLKYPVVFYILNYNIGSFFTLEEWKKHYKDVKSTLEFLTKHELDVIKQVKNLKEDIETLDELIKDFFKIKNEEKSTMNHFKEFEDKLTKIEIKNEIYKNNIIYSIKGNIEYLSKYISAMREEYKDIDSKVEELINLKESIYNLQEENKKTKDFYLTVSGAVMALISLVSGNISMVSNQIFISHILIFNCSILTAILIFSSLFNSIYNQKNEGYPKRAVKIIIGLIVVFIFCILLYK